MPNTLLSQVEAHLATDHISLVNLLEFDFGDVGSPYRFATQAVTYDGDAYEQRIPRKGGIGRLYRTVGSDEKTTDILVANKGSSPASFAALESGGVEIDGGRIRMVRWFPKLASPNDYVGQFSGNPYWHGRIVEHTIGRKWLRAKIAWGWLELSRRAGWKIQAGCRHMIGDGFMCPYAPTSGFGRPQALAEGATAVISGTTVTVAGETFVTKGVQVGHVCLLSEPTSPYNTDVGVVDRVNSETEIGVTSWLFGGPSQNWNYVVGPEIDKDTHAYTKDACIQAGMFAPTAVLGKSRLNRDKRRYFGGWTEPKARSSTPLITLEDGKKGRFSRTPTGNRGVVGQRVPLVVGQAVRHNVPAYAWSDEGDFGHMVFFAAYGRCYALGNVEVAGDPPDNQDLSIAVYRDSLVLYGWDRPTFSGTDLGNDKDFVGIGGFTEEQRMRAVGSLQSWAVNFRQELEQYEDNPYRANGSDGDGLSMTNISGFRIRTEPDGGFNPRNITASMAITGWMVKRFNDTWTAQPDIAELAVNFLRDPGVGPGLTDESFDLTIWEEFSDYCRALVTNTQTGQTIDTGMGPESPGPGPGEGDNPESPNPRWLFIETSTHTGAEFVGGEIEVVGGVNAQTKTVVDTIPVKSLPKHFAHPLLSRNGHGFIARDADVGKQGFIALTDGWEKGKTPSSADTLRLRSFQTGTVPRFMANGVVLEDEQTVATALEKSILINAGGPTTSYIQNMGKVIPVWTQSENMTTVNARKTITDQGADRNIVKRKGVEEPVKWTPFNKRKVPTTLVVGFPNRAKRFETDEIPIKNRQAENRLKNDFGVTLRDRREMELSLPLLSSADEALRAGSKALREHGYFLEGGFLRTLGELKFEMPIHDCIEMIPIRDVYPCSFASDDIPDWITHIRIWSMEENVEGATFTITARPHVQSIYDDTADDAMLNRYPEAEPDDVDAPGPVRQYEVTTGQFTQLDGRTVESVFSKVDLP